MFCIIFAGEGIAIGVGSGIAAATGNVDWIPAITAIIVGLHFFPLGYILEITADNLHVSDGRLRASGS